MSVKTQQIACMVEMLPENEQEFAFEFVKRLILAWDPDYTKLTPYERTMLEQAEDGEFIDNDDIDWDNLGQYAD
ncbi:MAG: hypothetical protein FWH20_02545 [Oscillospiraceae bacterium]|nr:hypothetical protein [Oscillospiraceae bacterium]